jgi:hypothetical protein
VLDLTSGPVEGILAVVDGAADPATATSVSLP